MSGEILFLAHRLPFPPDRGDKIRSHHVLKALAEIAPVHVGCFIDSEGDHAHVGELAQLAASYCVVQRAKPLWLAGIEAVWRNEPVSLPAFDSKQLRQWVRRTVASREIAAIYVFSGQMGQFVPEEWCGRLLVDLVDVDSAKFEAYGEEASFPQDWINRREGRLLLRVERELTERADHTLLVSQAEAELLRQRTGNAGHISALRNGIDAEHFAPEILEPHESLRSGGPHIVFTGQMDYAPNIAAAIRMAKRIMARIVEMHPRAIFHIVGRAPTAKVLALGELDFCRVHGEVPDVRPFLAGADLVAAPLTIARGVQNKVLEAMAMACPVLLSPEAATGIEAEDGEHFAVAADDAQLTEKSLDLLADPARARSMGQAAREVVVEHQAWPAMLANLPHLLRMPAERGQRDAA